MNSEGMRRLGFKDVNYITTFTELMRSGLIGARCSRKDPSLSYKNFVEDWGFMEAVKKDGEILLNYPAYGMIVAHEYEGKTVEVLVLTTAGVLFVLKLASFHSSTARRTVSACETIAAANVEKGMTAVDEWLDDMARISYPTVKVLSREADA